MRNHADKDPGYEPPKQIQAFSSVRENIFEANMWKLAKSAKLSIWGNDDMER